jgi:1-deoxy-D-xylulose-5-phosphate reductoisomerase
VVRAVAFQDRRFQLLEGRLRFTAIPLVIEQALERMPAAAADDLETVLDADRRARRAAADGVAALMARAA